MHILMVLTSHAALGRSGRPTGFWLEELAAPYCAFQDAGAQVRLASPQGGLPLVDPASLLPAAQTDATRRFQADPQAQEALAHVKDAEGRPVVQGQHVTGFSNDEEAAGGLAAELPFLVQDLLQAQGAAYTHAAAWQPHVVVDGLLVTGQNPASSGPAALRLLERLRDPA